MFPAKWRSCQAGVGCPEIWGGPVPIWWFNEVSIRRPRRGVWPLGEQRGEVLVILWGWEHRHQRLAPIALLRWAEAALCL